MDDRDLLEWEAQALRHELSERRLVTLSVSVAPREHLDRADGIDTQFGRFPEANARPERAGSPGGCRAARFDIGRKADAPQLAGFRALPLALGEVGILGHLERSLETARIVARIVRKKYW